MWLIPSSLQLFIPACIDPVMGRGEREEEGRRGGGGTSSRIALTHRPIRPCYYSHTTPIVLSQSTSSPRRVLATNPSINAFSPLMQPVNGSIVRGPRRRGRGPSGNAKRTRGFSRMRSGLTIRGKAGRRSPFSAGCAGRGGPCERGLWSVTASASVLSRASLDRPPPSQTRPNHTPSQRPQLHRIHLWRHKMGGMGGLTFHFLFFLLIWTASTYLLLEENGTLAASWDYCH